ncbi:MMtag superfamily domain-containing protein [Histoplasma capsulatum G186AR]|uniref:MMtag superfamily domain-containing protein n=1 Tax=Ajellomyces capsulatus TaxID=5037 RepID=A0A8H8D781_AJECA|nr:MMtag superfamily domain-containing protein [Histoplasma capsulatum]QSS68975.1 MMtag superfamily domain-containing protein [Histoplasma capsulatum G186AR]
MVRRQNFHPSRKLPWSLPHGPRRTVAAKSRSILVCQGRQGRSRICRRSCGETTQRAGGGD